MTYKSKSTDLLFQIYVDDESVLLQFREGIYKTEDRKLIKACDGYIKEALGDNLKPPPFFLSEEAFNKLHIPNELISVLTDRYGKIDVYAPVNYITKIYEYLKTLHGQATKTKGKS